MDFDYTNITDKITCKTDKLINKDNVVISIITPFYNAKKYLEDTAKCVINQTFPFFEWLIVDDGSTDEDSLNYLQQIKSMDPRIKVFHKENSGQADTRDYGVHLSNPNSKYILFLDDDDIIDDTYLECAYWTLETNKGASWAYTDIVHFGELEALAAARFDPEMEKRVNNIVVTALIRKQDFLQVGGFALKEKGIWEDWNLWLKMIAAGMYPVRMDFWGFWYRRKEKKESELAKSNSNKTRAKEIIDRTARSIKNPKEAIQYPKQDYNWDIIEEKIDSIIIPKYEDNNKTKILMIIPWMVMGGADKFNIDMINGLDKDKFEITIISTEPNFNPWREQYKAGTKAIYDLTTFLDRKNWLAFINYIIEKNNIDIVLNTNSTFGYSILPYLKAKYNDIPIIDYIHMEEWYNRNGGFSRDSSAVASVIDKTLVCNENSRKILINHFGRNENEVETVYIGVDENKFNPDKFDKNTLKEKYKIPKDDNIIGFIARIDLQKRPILLMNVIKALKEERDDFCVVVAGNGPMLKKIQSLARKYKLDKNIRFLGAISNTAEIYSVCDVTLNCSIKEGLALTSYESLSMGVPVISSDVGGQSELINDEVGVIVPCLQEEKDVSVFEYSKDEINSYVIAINTVLNNLEKYKANARNRVLSGFTINHMIDRMSYLLEEIANNPDYEKKVVGNNLASCIDICKELNTKYFTSFKGEYEWLVKETDKKIDEEVDKRYKINQRKTADNSNGKIMTFIKNEGKRAFLNKCFVKLHIYHEMKIIMRIIERVYWMLKTILLTFVGTVLDIVKLVKVIGIRVINLFLKLVKKDTIKIEDET